MNNYDIDVNPKDFIVVNTANKVEFRVSNLQIGISVDITLLIKDLNGNIFKVENVKIEGEEYDNWGTDDQYLVNLVLSKVGLTQKEEESN
jgi:hypothetical protein